MSVLTELLPLSLAMAGKGLTGIYNFTNPGVISHNEVLALYQAEVDPDFAWENFSVQEQASILAAGRSNNCLDTTKLEAAAAALGMPLPDIHSATRAALRAARKHLEVPAPPAAPARSPPRRADAAAPRPRETTPRGCQRSSAPATARCRQHSRGAPSAMHGVAARGACGEVRAAAVRVREQRSVQRFAVATGAAAPLPQRARALHCEVGLAEKPRDAERHAVPRAVCLAQRRVRPAQLAERRRQRPRVRRAALSSPAFGAAAAAARRPRLHRRPPPGERAPGEQRAHAPRPAPSRVASGAAGSELAGKLPSRRGGRAAGAEAAAAARVDSLLRRVQARAGRAGRSLELGEGGALQRDARARQWGVHEIPAQHSGRGARGGAPGARAYGLRLKALAEAEQRAVPGVQHLSGPDAATR